MNSKENLIKAFEDLRGALKTCNMLELRQIILDEYRGFSLNGSIEIKDDILEHFKPGCIILSKYEVSEIAYEVFSEIGIVSGKGLIEGSYENHEFHHKVLFTDIFKYIDNSWRYFKSQVTEIRSL